MKGLVVGIKTVEAKARWIGDKVWQAIKNNVAGR